MESGNEIGVMIQCIAVYNDKVGVSIALVLVNSRF